MEAIVNLAKSANILTLVRNIISTMVVWDYIDILVIAWIIYKVITFVRRSSSSGVIKGIILLIAVMFLSSIANLNMVNYLLGKTMEFGVLAVIVLFSPEIRKFLSQMGSNRIFSLLFGRTIKSEVVNDAINKVVIACESMSETKTGALIVFERGTMLDDYTRHGTVVDAAASPELIKNIFFHNAPLHDGAMIIRDGRIMAAGCMLPMSSNANISKELGMRHRAGIGMSEHTDALIVIVSEETGDISVAIDGMLKRKMDTDTLTKLMRVELMSNEDKKSIREKVFDKLGLGD